MPTSFVKSEKTLVSGGRMELPDGPLWPLLQASLEARFNDKVLTDKDVSLTGREVLFEVEKLSGLIVEPVVAVALGRSAVQVISVLAVIKAGGVFVPVAQELPRARREEILNMNWIGSVIGDEVRGGDSGRSAATTRVCDNEIFVSGTGARSSDERLSNAAYVAFTSGSTGTPKGCINTSDGLKNRLLSMKEFLGVSSADKILYKASTAFDVHIWEMLLPIIAGAECVVAPVQKILDVEELSDFIAKHQVSICVAVPTLLRQLLLTEEFTRNTSLRTLICGGEAWGADLANDFIAKLPGIELCNGYGPTETAIGVAFWKVPRSAPVVEILVGRPLPNNEFLLLEADACQEASVGELAIGGIQVGEGYIGQPDSESFFRIEGHSGWWYRTGDIFSFDKKTRQFKFVDRRDRQVKVSGIRIELSDLERSLERLPVIASSAVVWADRVHPKKFVFFYSTKAGQNAPPTDEIKRQLSELVWPTIVAQSEFHQLEELPELMSGKVDYSALRALAEERRMKSFQ